MTSVKRPILLCVSSGGGHLEQMLKITKNIYKFTIILVSTEQNPMPDKNMPHFILSDYNKKRPFHVFLGIFETLRVVRGVKPDCVLSTGAAPGLLACIWGKLFRIRVLWVDSVANVERLSLSGRIAKYCRIPVLSQWPHLSDGAKVRYFGSVI